jgi:hypothetical protein
MNEQDLSPAGQGGHGGLRSGRQEQGAPGSDVGGHCHQRSLPHAITYKHPLYLGIQPGSDRSRLNRILQALRRPKVARVHDVESPTEFNVLLFVQIRRRSRPQQTALIDPIMNYFYPPWLDPTADKFRPETIGLRHDPIGSSICKIADGLNGPTHP